jgi:hypothetical protein
MSFLQEIQSWYSTQCDGDWEHQYGIEIGTLDNPGWFLKIDLTGTHLSGVPFVELKNDVSENDWFHCKVENDQFAAGGGVHNLEHLLGVFLNWAKSDKGWLQPPVYERVDEENRRFYDSLPSDVKGEICKAEGCADNRIQNSIFCRNHHFEKYKQ